MFMLRKDNNFCWRTVDRNRHWLTVFGVQYCSSPSLPSLRYHFRDRRNIPIHVCLGRIPSIRNSLRVQWLSTIYDRVCVWDSTHFNRGFLLVWIEIC